MNLRLQECTLHLDVCKHLYSAQKKEKKKKKTVDTPSLFT